MEHIKRSFKVTLHINHPSIDPQVISSELALLPRSSHRVGQARITPAGNPLAGTFECSAWSFAFDATKVSDLSEFLTYLAKRLEPKASFFNQLVREGGRVELFCGIFADGNWDECYSHALLHKLATLSIDLRLDVYPKSENEKPSNALHAEVGLNSTSTPK